MKLSLLDKLPEEPVSHNEPLPAAGSGVSLKGQVLSSVHPRSKLRGIPAQNKNILKKVMIRNGDIPNITQFAKAVFPRGETAAGHIHKDMYEVFLIEKGYGTMDLNERKIPLRAGICITVEPGELHEITNTGEEDLVVLILGILKT